MPSFKLDTQNAVSEVRRHLVFVLHGKKKLGIAVKIEIFI